MEISIEKLKEMIQNQKNEPRLQKYFSWEKFDNKDFDNFEFVGEIKIENPINHEYPSTENYWSVRYPIALQYYPNNGSKIYFNGSQYYLVYDEYGGHMPEKRCRLIQSELIL